MSEQIHDQVSAFMDDELSAEECAFLVRRLERDPEARQKLERYSLIGAALRSELLLPDPAMLQRRVHKTLNGEMVALKPAIAAATAAVPAARHQRWANPVFGAGLAATVAVAALFVVRTVNDVGVEPATVDGQPLRAATSVESPSYVVPPEQQVNRTGVAPPIRLTNYLMHHGEYASRLGRTSVHSNVVGAIQAPTFTEASSVTAPSVPPPEREAQ